MTPNLAGGVKDRPANPLGPSPNREVLAGLVERVTFHNADNGFCVLRIKARGHRDLVTVVGHAAMVSAGEWITASGEWIVNGGAKRDHLGGVRRDRLAAAGLSP